MTISRITILLLLVMLLASDTKAQETAAVAGRLAQLNGQVTIRRPDRILTATPGMALYAGDRIITGSSSVAKIVLADESMVAVSERSTLVLSAIDISPQRRERRALLQLLHGAIRALVSTITDGESRFSIETPNAVTGVRGTHFLVEYRGGETTVMTLDGLVELSSRFQPTVGRLTIGASQMSRVRDRNLPDPILPLDPVRSRRLIDKTAQQINRLPFDLPGPKPDRDDGASDTSRHASVVARVESKQPVAWKGRFDHLDDRLRKPSIIDREFNATRVFVLVDLSTIPQSGVRGH